MRHTPKPWKIGAPIKSIGITIYRNDGPGVNHQRICRNVRTLADAKLIAQAPILLELVEAYLATATNKGGSRDLPDLDVRARAAIREIEG